MFTISTIGMVFDELHPVTINKDYDPAYWRMEKRAEKSIANLLYVAR